MELEPGLQAVPPGTSWRIWGFCVLALGLGFIASVVTGTHGAYFGSALQTAPFVILAVLGYLGMRHMWAGLLAVLWLLLLLFLFGMATGLGTLFVAAGGPAAEGIPPSALARTAPVLLWAVLGFAAGVTALLPPVRRAAARVLPLDPGSLVHALALALVSGWTVVSFGHLLALGAQPLLLTMLRLDPDLTRDMTAAGLTASMLFGLLWCVPSALVVTGFPIARTAAEAHQRLGLVRPTVRQVLGGLGLAVVLAGSMLLLDGFVTRLWQFAGWPRTDTEAFEALLRPLMTPFGALVIGLTAGVGEELVVRGALQPRLGIVPSNLFFTGLHAFQYSFDGLLAVFLIGLVLGVVRNRANTSTAAIVHGTYNFILVLAAALFGW
jgi:membrane protease YdiL (CAAX protease family)